MTNTININNLRIFVEALNKLPSEVKNNVVNMNSAWQPVCGTAGCHAGLVSIVADYIPELKSLYPQDLNDYSFSLWVDTLTQFLGFSDRASLKQWAYMNPNLWGNDWGISMFTSARAFGQKTNNFKHSVIIDHWTDVLKRVEQLNNKGESNGK